MKIDRFHDKHPTTPAALQISKTSTDYLSIQIEERNVDTLFVVRSPRQCRLIIAALQNALDEWEAELIKDGPQ